MSAQLNNRNASRILPYTAATVYGMPEFDGIAYSDYRVQLRRLRVELLRMQEWIEARKLRVAIVLEGRDAAGKGSTCPRPSRAI